LAAPATMKRPGCGGAACVKHSAGGDRVAAVFLTPGRWGELGL